MAKPVTYSDIEDAEAHLTSTKESYLRRWGWTLTCGTPGAYWLWKRDFAAEDRRRLRRWRDRKRRAEAKGERYTPSRPHPYGAITADRDLAVSMTVRALDSQPELEGQSDEP